MGKKESGLVNDIRVEAATGRLYSASEIVNAGIINTNGSVTINSKETFVISNGVADVSVSDNKLTINFNNGLTKEYAVSAAGLPVDGIQNISKVSDKLVVSYHNGDKKEIAIGLKTNISDVIKTDTKLVFEYGDGSTKELPVASTDVVKDLLVDGNNLVVSFVDGSRKEIQQFRPATAIAIPDAATDLNSAIALINAIRTVILNNKFATLANVAAPVNNNLPVISGTAKVGETLTVTLGNWSGTGLAYSYQWKLGNTAISGATTSQYVVRAGDAGKEITASITAVNAGGSVSVNSLSFAIPIPISAPINTAIPVISGFTKIGDTLTVTSGSWSGSAPSFSFQWNVANVMVNGATQPTYTILPEDIGKLVSVAVTASNSAGSATAMTVGLSLPHYFTVLPSITTDGSPSVDEVAVLNFGLATAPLGTKRLLRNTVDFADASAGSHKWDAAGSYELEVQIAGTSIKVKSPTVVVQDAVVGIVDAPILANPTNFVTGTNPPRQLITIPLNVDKTQYKLVGQWDFASSGSFNYDPSREFTISDLMAFAEAEQEAIAQYANQPVGPWRLRTRFVNLTDATLFSSWSNYWTDTLKAVPVKVPTLTFSDPFDMEPGFMALSADRQTVTRGAVYNNRSYYIKTNEAKTTGKWIAKIKVVARNDPSNVGKILGFGLATDAAPMQENFGPTSLRYCSHSYIAGNNVEISKVFPRWSVDDEMWLCFDCDKKLAWFAKNGEWVGGGNPTTEANPIDVSYMSNFRIIVGNFATNDQIKLLGLEPYNV